MLSPRSGLSVHHITPSLISVLSIACLFYILCTLSVYAVQMRRSQKAPSNIYLSDLDAFNKIKDSQEGLKSVRIIGNTSMIPVDHPVISAVIERWATGSKPGNRLEGDYRKIALSIEGGGMRGCVSAGASAAINFLGLNDAVDVVYGSSAGSMIGAFFVSRQLSGVRVYHGTTKEDTIILYWV